MGVVTGIEWADSTLNLQMGCDGCELWNPKTGVKDCYAGVLTERRAGRPGYPNEFGKPRLFLERLDEAVFQWRDLTGTDQDRADKPWLNGLPRIIFLDDMGDTFTESLPIDWLARPYGPLRCPKGHRPPIVQHVDQYGVCVCTRCASEWDARSPLQLMASSPHQFLLLTKRAARMRDFAAGYPFPDNVWPGVSVTNTSKIGRILDLLCIESGGPKWISYEPALGPLRLVEEWLTGAFSPQVQKIGWIVCGGASGKHAKPMHPDWARSPRDMCLAAGVPFFFKQWGEWIDSANTVCLENPLKPGSIGDDRCCWLSPNGGMKAIGSGLMRDDDECMIRAGKARTGRLLDGSSWTQMPEVKHATNLAT